MEEEIKVEELNRVGRLIIDYDLPEEVKEDLEEAIDEVDGIKAHKSHDMKIEVIEDGFDEK